MNDAATAPGGRARYGEGVRNVAEGRQDTEIRWGHRDGDGGVRMERLGGQTPESPTWMLWASARAPPTHPQETGHGARAAHVLLGWEASPPVLASTCRHCSDPRAPEDGRGRSHSVAVTGHALSTAGHPLPRHFAPGIAGGRPCGRRGSSDRASARSMAASPDMPSDRPCCCF